MISFLVWPGFPDYSPEWVNHISLVGNARGTLSAKLAGSLPRFGLCLLDHVRGYADSTTLGSMRTPGLIVDDNVMRFK